MMKGQKGFYRSSKAVRMKAHGIIWIALAVLLATEMICFGAQGGWRTQQGPEKELHVETPPIPGVPYGKTPQEDVNLPPEIKEIDEKIKKDAQQLIAPLRSVTQGTQETQPGSADGSKGQLPQQAGPQVPGTGQAPTQGTDSGPSVGVGPGTQTQAPAVSSEPGKAAQTQGAQTQGPTGTSESKVASDQKMGSEPGKSQKGTDKSSVSAGAKRDQIKEDRGADTGEANLQTGDKGKSSGFLVKGLIALVLIGLSIVVLKVFFKRS